jgi:Delta7-sterol 5-desaturase
MEALKEILSLFPKNYLQGFLSTGLVVGIAYLVFWKLLKEKIKKWRILQKELVNNAQLLRELKNAIFTLSVGTLFSCIMFYMSTKGYTKLYTDASAYHPIWNFGVFFILLLIDDAWFYWCHRLMHHPRLYKYIHAEHHKSVDVNPVTSLSFHFIEPTILTLWIIPMSFIVPIYVPVLGAVQLWGLLDNIKSHLGYEFFPKTFNKSWLRFLTTSTYHNMHHTKFNGNYGVHFRIWDRLFGTEFKEYEANYDAIKERSEV